MQQRACPARSAKSVRAHALCPALRPRRFSSTPAQAVYRRRSWERVSSSVNFASSMPPNSWRLASWRTSDEVRAPPWNSLGFERCQCQLAMHWTKLAIETRGDRGDQLEASRCGLRSVPAD
eukprot:scaffold67107_cov72-Phaeocystis_antarctica.AAC.3